MPAPAPAPAPAPTCQCHSGLPCRNAGRLHGLTCTAPSACLTCIAFHLPHSHSFTHPPIHNTTWADAAIYGVWRTSSVAAESEVPTWVLAMGGAGMVLGELGGWAQGWMGGTDTVLGECHSQHFDLRDRGSKAACQGQLGWCRQGRARAGPGQHCASQQSASMPPAVGAQHADSLPAFRHLPSPRHFPLTVSCRRVRQAGLVAPIATR